MQSLKKAAWYNTLFLSIEQTAWDLLNTKVYKKKLTQWFFSWLINIESFPIFKSFTFLIVE